MQPDERPYQIGAVLTGAPTIFLEPAEEYLRILRESEKNLSAANYSAEGYAKEWLFMAEQFKDAKILQAKPGELARWLVARKDLAVIHSEPLMYEPRIFLCLLPGTEAQIRELAKKWCRPFMDGKPT